MVEDPLLSDYERLLKQGTLHLDSTDPSPFLDSIQPFFSSPSPSFHKCLTFLSEALLCRDYNHFPCEVHLKVNDFLQTLLKYILPRLKKDSLELLEILLRILNFDNPYYSSRSTQIPETVQISYISSLPQYRESQSNEPTIKIISSIPNFLFTVNINLFIQELGFSKLVLLSTEVIPYKFLVKILAFFASFEKISERDFWRRVCKDLKEKILMKIMNFSDDEMKNMQKGEIKKFLNYFDNFLHVLYSKGKCFKVMTAAELSLAYRFLTSKYLEKRIAGLVDINSKIGDVQDLGFRSDNKQLEAGFLIEWVERHDLLDVIFGSSTHPELVKRSKELVKLLYIHNRFDKNNIGKLWDCAVVKHETDRVALINLFTDLCETFKLSDLQFLFSKIVSLDLNEIDSSTLSLIKSLALNSSKSSSRSNDEKGEGCWKEPEELKENFTMIRQDSFTYTEVLDFLWKLVQDTTEVASSISKQAYLILKDLLSTYNCRGDRHKFLSKCIENLKRNSSIVTSCKLLEELVLSYSDIRSNYDESKATIVKTLDREYHLLSELFTSFLLFKTEAVELAQLVLTGEKLDDEREDVCFTCSSDDDSHESEERGKKHAEVFRALKVSKDSDMSFFEELKFRLNFIKFLFKSSSETFQIKHLQVLWEAMVLNAVCEEEFEIFFGWLSGCIDVWFMGGALVNEEITHFVFTDLFLKLDARSMSYEGFKCFEKLFINLNKQHGLIVSDFHGHIEAKESSLLGMQYLWEVILKSKQKSVFRIASRFIHTLYKTLSHPRDQKIDDFLINIREFITEGVERVQIHLDQDSYSQILRCVIILTEFLQEFENKSETTEILIKNQVPNTYPKSFKLSLLSKTLVSSLKTLIVSQISPILTTSEIVLFLGNKKISFRLERKTVKDLELGPESFVSVFQISKELEKAEENFLENLETLKSIFQGFCEDVLITALENSNNSLEDAVNMLVNEEVLNDIQEKVEKNKGDGGCKSVSEILSSNESYFNLLFTLFDLGNENISNRVWKLLAKCPVNPLILEKIHKLDEGWKSILSSVCHHKLLYGLNIIKDILTSELSENWKEKFYLSGGIDHLYKIVMTSQRFDDKSKSFLVCLENLIKTLKVFIIDQLQSTSEQVKSIDFLELTGKMLEIIETCASKELDGTSLIERALDFMVPLIISHPFLLSEIYKRDSFNSLVNYLLDSEKSKVRESIKFTILSIVESIPSPPGNLEAPVNYFLKVLLQKLPENSHNHCDEYFEVLVQLIKEGYSEKILLDKSLETIERLLKDPGAFGDKEESLLKGYLNLASTLLDFSPPDCTGLIKVVYSSLIDGENHPAKFTQESSRRSAFALLLNLARYSRPNFNSLLEGLSAYHLPRSILTDYRSLSHLPGRSELDFLNSNFDSEITGKSSTGFVGLRNFGATCYLNSLLQQLFMIRSFRKGIQEAEIFVEDLEEDLGDNLLFQLKVVFWNLEESDKQFFEPSGFCKAFKDYDGLALNVKQQQDVDEFFNLLHDKIEEILKPTRHRTLFQVCVGGKFVHEIKSLEADFPYKSLREETFYRISLDIINKKTLSEALDLFVKEDILDGDNQYYCDQYDKKIPAEKRCLISDLSNTVIIHLKRFEFNYNTMQRTKINDFCEFPTSIDFKTWSDCSHSEDSYYLYDLVGVLVHSGSADVGHYFSIIKDRDRGSWFKFDDKHVEYFDVSHLKEECFGSENLQNWNFDEVSYPKTRNAYLLIYQRSTQINDFSQDKEEPQGLFINPVNKIRSKIRKENKEFLRDKFFFSSSYSDFLKDFLACSQLEGYFQWKKELSLTQDLHKRWKLGLLMQNGQQITGNSWTELEARPEVFEIVLQVSAHRADMNENREVSEVLVKIATIYMFEALLRARQSGNFISWLSKLNGWFKGNNGLSVWILQFFIENFGILAEVLIFSREEVKNEFRTFLVQVISQAAVDEEEYLIEKIKVLVIENSFEPCGEELELFGSSFDLEDEYFSATARFFKMFFSGLVRKAMNNMKASSEVFAVITILSQKERIFKLFSHFSVTFNLISQFTADIAGVQVNSYSDKLTLIETAANLTRRSKTRSMISSNNLPFYASLSSFKFEDSEENDLLSCKTIEKLVLAGKNYDSIHILTHLLWENLSASRIALWKFVSSIFDVKYEQNRFNSLLFVGFHLLTIKDSLKYERAKLLVTLPVYKNSESENTFFDHWLRSRPLHFFNAVLVWWSDLLKYEEFSLITTENERIFKEVLSNPSKSDNNVYYWDYLDNTRHLSEEVIKCYSKLRQIFKIEELEPEQPYNNNDFYNTDESETDSL